MTARTLLDKLWERHEIARDERGASLLWVDRHFVHEGSHHAFRKLAERDLPVARSDLTFGVVDHYAPTTARDSIFGPVPETHDRHAFGECELSRVPVLRAG